MSERLERIEEMHTLANDAYDKGSMEKAKEILEQLFVGEDTDWLIEQTKELHGTAHHYGYKDMYGICNRDYAHLKSENERLREALKEIAGFSLASNDLIAVSALKEEKRIARQALRGDHK